MAEFKCKNIIKFSVFLLVCFKEISCSPVGEDVVGINSLFKLFSSTRPERVNENPIESRIPKLLRYETYIPYHKFKFGPERSQDSYDYPNFGDHKRQQMGPKFNRHGKNFVPWYNSWEENEQENQKSFEVSDEDEDDSVSNERRCKEVDSNNEYEDYSEFNGKHRGFDFNSAFNGRKFGLGHNHGHHRTLHHHHHGHNHNFHHDHTPGCLFPHGPGNRRPRPGPSSPGTTVSPTIVPTTTNPPSIVPTTTTTTTTPVSIDPRRSTLASVMRTQVPAIDIRFGRGTRGVIKDDFIVFPE